MFPEMIKKKYELSEEAAVELLKNGCYGVLSTLSPDGYCYGVPLHHVMIGRRLYMHCAPKDGHKLEAIRNHPQVCYTVVDGRLMLLEGKRDTRYSSVCVFGKAFMVTDREEKAAALTAIIEKFDPVSMEWIQKYTQGDMPVGVIGMDIEHISGKSSFLEGDVPEL